MGRKLAVMEVERFAIHDGPGIRTTVFLQGCPLHCRWCANPESLDIGVHLLYQSEKCVGCGACFRVCEHEAISFKNDRPIFHREKCIKCRKCADVCLQNAIHFSGELMEINNIMDLVLRDKDYYDNSGGGITVSGGEAFLQFEGFMELLQECKRHSLHTAVETCGQYSLEKLKAAMPLVNIFLFDLKHTDPMKLHDYTGGCLDQILTNIRYIADKDPERLVLRIPVLPDFNFNKQTMNSIFDIAVEYGISNVHLLPYHTLGLSKYNQLGLTYGFKAKKSLLKADLIPYKKIGEDKGLNIQIGG